MNKHKKSLLRTMFYVLPLISTTTLAVDEVHYTQTNLGGQGIASCTYSQNCSQEIWGIDLNDNTGYKWDVDRSLDGASALFFKLASLSGTRKMSLWVNNEKINVIEVSASSAPRPTGNIFGPFPVHLMRGNNLIELRDTEGSSEFDIHHFELKDSALSKVEILASSSDDQIRILKDGIFYPISKFGSNVSGVWQDISHLFHKGSNIFNIQGINLGGPANFTVSLRVNGSNVQSFSCMSNNCGEPSEAFEAVVLDQEVELTNLIRPAKQELEITSYEGGKIYINDQYTGLSSPNSVELTPGAYRIGVGIDNGTAQPKYLEKNVVVKNHKREVGFYSSDSPVSNRNVVKIGVLPIRTGTGGGLPISTTLTDNEISKVMSNLLATNEDYIERFSYGLASWSFTLLPTFEEAIDITEPCSVLELMSYADMLDQQFDVIMVVHSQKYPSGEKIWEFNGGYSTGQCVSFADASLPEDQSAPSDLIVHEMLHQYEGIQSARISTYSGAQGVHGSEEHGFNDSGSSGWVPWYTLFMRGQVGEVSSMRGDQNPIPVPVSNPDYFIGSFHSIMHGFRASQTINHFYGKCINVASGLSYPILGSKISLESDCKGHSAGFSLLSNGVLKHNLSGYCVVPENGLAINNQYAVLSNNCTADVATQFGLTEGGSLQHVASGKCLHPEGGGYTAPESGTLLLLHDGCDQNRLKFIIN